MRHSAHGYKIETATQKKARFDEAKREAEQQAKQGQGIATRYNDANRDDKKDHTPPYNHR
jgi:hypothetical protein